MKKYRVIFEAEAFLDAEDAKTKKFYAEMIQNRLREVIYEIKSISVKKLEEIKPAAPVKEKEADK